MICKYCGEELVEGKCPKCGTAIMLESRSIELEQLMKTTLGKAYKGNNQEYQKGLQEGYKNGLKDGVAKDMRTQTVEDEIFVKKAMKFLPVIFATFLILVLVPVSLLFYHHGVQKGGRQTREKLSIELEQTLQVEYDNGYSDGEKFGWDSAMKSPEFEQLIAEAFQKGLEEGKKSSSEAIITTEIRQDENEESGTNEDEADDILYSLKDKDREIEKVRLIQEKLIELGYLEGTSADGYFGDKTLAAIRQFQIDQKMPAVEDGIDRSTYERLFSTVVPGVQIEDDAAIITADGSNLGQ